jgi:hypothetical protein
MVSDINLPYCKRFADGLQEELYASIPLRVVRHIKMTNDKGVVSEGAVLLGDKITEHERLAGIWRYQVMSDGVVVVEYVDYKTGEEHRGKAVIEPDGTVEKSGYYSTFEFFP